MASSTTNISIRMDSNLKAQADALFGELGMNLGEPLPEKKTWIILLQGIGPDIVNVFNLQTH